VFNLILKIFYPLILALNISAITVNISFKRIRIKCIVLCTLVNYFIILFLYISKLNILLPVIFFLSITVHSCVVFRNICRAIVIALCVNIIFTASDALAGFIDIYIFNFNYYQVVHNLKIHFIIELLVFLISYALSKIFRMILNRVYDKDRNIKDCLGENLIATFYIVIGTAIINVHLIMYKRLVKSLGRVNVCINMILVVGFFGMSVFLMYSSSKSVKNKLRQEYKDKEYQRLKEYTDKIENMSDELRRFKHDYMNILQTLGGYIDERDIDGLREFYNNDLLKESNKIIDKDRYLSLLKHIKISALKALIASKVINAYSHGVEIRIEISDDIYELQVSIIDICRIVGILLDNAIEAAALCDIKNVHIAIIKNDDFTVFIINNSCSEDTPPIYKIYDKNFSTKGEGRGIGLKTVRHIIDEKYSNITLNTKIENCTFKQELIIRNIEGMVGR
jgi:two-component system sensor histidine kinase AgrC